jgi:hypothetical protein
MASWSGCLLSTPVSFFATASPLGFFCVPAPVCLIGWIPWHVGRSKAGEGNRTLVFSLEGYGSTIELHPHLVHSHCVRIRRVRFHRARVLQPPLAFTSPWVLGLAVTFTVHAARPLRIHAPECRDVKNTVLPENKTMSRHSRYTKTTARRAFRYGGYRIRTCEGCAIRFTV